MTLPTLIIKNGTIVDGTGNKKFKGDVVISGKRIEKIKSSEKIELLKKNQVKVIDANGLYVTPGFIDIHNHSDSFWTLFTAPLQESMVMQGVTTIIGGNCGSSIAPLLLDDAIKAIRKWVDIRKINIDWQTMSQLFETLQSRKIGVNFATLVGHETLRRGLLKDEVRDITDEEMLKMEKMLEQALIDGAWGLSTGLMYSHAKLASIEEIIKLARIVKRYGGIYSSHIRGEGEDLIWSIEEAVTISENSDVSTQVAHLKAVGQNNWPKIKKALSFLEEAVAREIDIDFNVYPYSVSASVLYVSLPEWAIIGGRLKIIERLKNPELKKRIILEMQETGKTNNMKYEDIIIGACFANRALVGKKISQIAEEKKISEEEAIVDILSDTPGQVIGFAPVLGEENVKMLISHPLSIVATNGVGYNLDYAQTGQLVHPRCFGTFPRLLGKYVREEKLLSWEDAIHKITGKPAEKIRLKKRGILTEGNFADITIFDPKTIADKSSFHEPFQYPVGIKYVIINGEIVVENSKHTGKVCGEILRR